MAAIIQFRRDTAANWTSNNPTLAIGEIGYETDGSGNYKIGDGSTTWTSLGYGGLGDIHRTLIDAKGDLIVGTAADTAGRLAVGSNGQMLVADSSAAGGIAWAANDTLVNWHEAVDLATVSAIAAASSTYDNGTAGVGATLTHTPTTTPDDYARLQIDGTNVTTGDRVLLQDQVSAAHNGLYEVTAQGVSGVSAWVLTRADDFDGTPTGQIKQGEAVYALGGTTNGGQGFTVTSTSDPHTVGTHDIVWTQFTGTQAFTAGTYLTITGNTIDHDNSGVSAASYGSATQVPVLTTDAQGHLTAVSNTTIAIPSTAITDFTEAVQDVTGAQLVTNGSHSGIAATYDDAGDGAIDLNVDDFTITLAGDLSGNTTITNLADATLTATIVADATALGTDTTGNYVATIAGTANEVEVSGSGSETAAVTVGLPSAVTVTTSLTTPLVNVSGASIVLEGATANDFETTLTVTDPTADRTITLPDATGTVVTTGNLSAATEHIEDTVAAQLVTNGSHSGIAATYDDAGDGAIDLNVDDFTITLAGDLGGSATVTNLADATLTATIQANSVALGTDTTGDYTASLVAGTGVTLTNNSGETATPTVAIGQAVGTTDTPTFGSVTISSAVANATHAATKAYVDNAIAGLDWHEAVNYGSAAALPNTPAYDNGTSGVGATLTAGAQVRLVIDGANATTGNRVLVQDQATGAHNGIYDVTAQGAAGSAAWVLTRATDFDGAPTGEIKAGEAVYVLSGSANSGQGFVVTSTSDPHTVGSDTITWTQFTGTQAFSAGTYLTITGNTIDHDASGVSAAAYGSATQVPGYTVDAQGHLTAASNTTIAIPSTAVTDFTEAVQDVAGAQVATNGSHTGIAATYDDAGDGAIDLALTASGVSAASYGSATQVPGYTVDTYGRLTAASNTTIAIPSTAVTDFTEAVQDVSGAQLVTNGSHTHLTATYDDGGDGAIDIALNVTAVTAAAYGSATQVPGYTVDAYGRLTAAANTTIAIPSTAVTDFTEAVQDVSGAQLATNGSHTGITATYDDGGDGAIDLALVTENVQDISGAQLATNGSHTGITATYDDAGDGAIDLALITENVQDITGAQIATNGTHVGLTAVYDDAGDGAVDLTVAATLGTHTSGNYVATVAGTANEVEVSGSGSETAAVTVGLPSAVTVTTSLTTPLVNVSGASIVVEGATANDFETTLTVTDPTADRTVTFQDASGTVAYLASPTFTGVPAAPTAAADTNTTQIATTAYVQTELGALSSTSILDADSDTKIQVEESADEDIIRFDTAGTERMTINATGVVATVGAVTVGGVLTASGGIADGATTTTQSSQDNSTKLATTAYVDTGVYGGHNHSHLMDGDNDTKIWAEKNADEDILRFDTAGTERMSIAADGTVTIVGNLTVSGTTTEISSTTITVDDKNIELGSVASPTDVTADGGGLTLKGTTDKTFNWVDSTDAWTSSEHLALATGKSIYIDGVLQLSKNALAATVVLADGVAATTQSANDSTTKVATTAFVMTEIGDYAPLASPTFTGVPAAPTAAADTNTTQIATTAYVQTELGALSSDSIIDADSDTKIQVEESADEDKIRFDTGGTERAVIDSTGVDVTGNVSYNISIKEINESSGTTYTFVLADRGQMLRVGDESNNTSAQSLTIPPNSSVAFPIGTQVQITQMGGQVTMVAGSGVTLRYTPGLKTRVQYSSITCIKIATDEWILIGDLDDD